MEKLKLPKSFGSKIIFHSSYCEEHNRPIQRMVINENVICPFCEREKENQTLQAKMQKQYDEMIENEAYNTLAFKSLVEDQTLLDARLKGYIANEDEEVRNKAIICECLSRYKDGQVFNVILQGNQGSGKSHLSYGLLYELNESRKFSCLFISIESMIRKIKDSFRNPESKYTEEYFVNLLSNVDILALDDLGAETGAIDTERRATDFVQRILYAVTTVRQNKSTVVTTNLDSKTLYSMYDKKLISRLFKNPKFIIFKETKDKRTNSIPF